MSSDQLLPRQSGSPKLRSRLALLSFMTTVFMSALLLFAVQPMFTRMVLPKLGGSPSVWSVAMVFFQSTLLAGYAYAHYVMKAKRSAFAVGVHLALMLAAGVTLPLSIAQGWGAPPSDNAALWLLGLFLVSIGLPFFALSANTPLLQAWFVRTGGLDAHDPYFLNVASNVGSFLALLSYPVLLEPILTLQGQNRLWSGGFWLLFGLIAWCGYLLLRAPAPAEQPAQADANAALAPGWTTVGRWLFLAAIPSGLLVAVTAHISTDVAAGPLLWIIPLSLYLLTWVLVFQTRPLLPHRWMLAAQPFAVAGVVVLMAAFALERQLVLSLAGHLLAFFLIAMASHGELARQRPPPQFLTTFYVSLSAGGMIGGLFAGLIAPAVFTWIAEYPILLVLAILCRPAALVNWNKQDRLIWALAVVLAVALLLPGLILGWTPTDEASTAIIAMIMTIAGVSILLSRTRFKSAFAIAVALTMVHLYPEYQGRFESVRSFFGVHKIVDAAKGQFRVLMHGTTIHGAQKLKDDEGQPISGRPEPLTYHHRSSAIAQSIEAVRNRKGDPLRVAVIGLGAGSLACVIEPGDIWRFFEIDPLVIEIARDPSRFTFIQSCAPDLSIVLGDARLTLAREPDGYFDLVIVDAYSSDSIPVHLATREAMAIYKLKLASRGAVVMHITNRHLELASVVAGIAAANGMKTWISNNEEEVDHSEYIFSSEVAISVGEAADVGELATKDEWKFAAPDPAQRVWTDEYSNIAGAILRRLWQRLQ